MSSDDGPEEAWQLGRLRCLAGRTYTVHELRGGLTNHNLAVVAGEDHYVVRIGASHAGLLAIDRDHEHHNSVVAARAGVGPAVIEYRPDLHVLVVGYLEGQTCSKEDLAQPDRLARVVDACRRLHGSSPFANTFDMFALQRFYLSIVGERGFRLPSGYVDFEPEVERVRAALSAWPATNVPCHNDLLAENCIDEGVRVYLIDYEYSGNNDAAFELGNLWSESGLTLDALEYLIELYYGDARPDQVARARLQGLMSKYGWTLWASIQDGQAMSDFDFWAWGMEKYERAVAEFRGRDFERLLDQAAGGPVHP